MNKLYFHPVGLAGAALFFACMVCRQCAAAEPKDVSAEFFNGKDLSNWVGNTDVWKLDNGEIVGNSGKGLKVNEFLKNKMPVSNFRLVVEVKLTPDDSNSGIQFRSVALPDSTEMRGYQADMGKTWWGKLYHESGRGMLSKNEPPEGAVKPGEWNTYEIVAVGHHIRTSINGQSCVDLTDPQGELEGLIAVQVHAGGPLEVRFRNFKLELNPPDEVKVGK